MRRDRASARFEEAVEVPRSGIAHAELEERINAASREYSQAIMAVSDALQAYNSFVLHGTIPQGLLESEGESRAS